MIISALYSVYQLENKALNTGNFMLKYLWLYPLYTEFIKLENKVLNTGNFILKYVWLYPLFTVFIKLENKVLNTGNLMLKYAWLIIPALYGVYQARKQGLEHR